MDWIDSEDQVLVEEKLAVFKSIGLQRNDSTLCSRSNTWKFHLISLSVLINHVPFWWDILWSRLYMNLAGDENSYLTRMGRWRGANETVSPSWGVTLQERSTLSQPPTHSCGDATVAISHAHKRTLTITHTPQVSEGLSSKPSGLGVSGRSAESKDSDLMAAGYKVIHGTNAGQLN